MLTYVCVCVCVCVCVQVWYTGCAWAVHCIVASVLLRMMSLPIPLPWSELIAYTGYVFVPACATLLVNMSGSECKARHW